MIDRRVYLQPAYILRARHYRESSLLIDAFTRDYGRVALLAKGVRKAKSKAQGLLQPFIPLHLSFVGRTELKTVTGVELAEASGPLGGLALYCGFYLNELLTAFLHQDDPHPEVFADYRHCLEAMRHASEFEAILRSFELDLLEKTGFGLHFGGGLDPEQRYHLLDADLRPVAAEDGLYSGKTLLALASRDFADQAVLGEAKVLLRRALDRFMDGKPLNSRKVLNDILKRL